jgi:molybdate transport system regulatory protein
MKLGARNAIHGTVKSVQSDKIMSLIKFTVNGPVDMASVITTESLEEMGLKPGDTVELVVKAIHVLPIKP